MSGRTEREAAKRRIMFVPGEDFYFLTYTLLILLKDLGATSPDKSFSDSRKLSYIADFLGGASDFHLAVSEAPLSTSGKSRLSLLHDRAVARRVAVERLVGALTTRGLIRVIHGLDQVDRLYLCETEQIKALLANSLYMVERERLGLLRKSLPQLRSMTLETLKKRLFGSHGVRTWGD